MSEHKRMPSKILAAALEAEKKRQVRLARKPVASSRYSNGRTQYHVDPGTVFQNEFAEINETANSFAWAICPFHDDHNPSLCVNLESGWYKCHASHCGETGSNIVSFVSCLHGLDFNEAREYLEANYG